MFLFVLFDFQLSFCVFLHVCICLLIMLLAVCLRIVMFVFQVCVCLNVCSIYVNIFSFLV